MLALTAHAADTKAAPADAEYDPAHPAMDTTPDDQPPAQPKAAPAEENASVLLAAALALDHVTQALATRDLRLLPRPRNPSTRELREDIHRWSHLVAQISRGLQALLTTKQGYVRRLALPRSTPSPLATRLDQYRPEPQGQDTALVTWVLGVLTVAAAAQQKYQQCVDTEVVSGGRLQVDVRALHEDMRRLWHYGEQLRGGAKLELQQPGSYVLRLPVPKGLPVKD